MSKKPTKKLGIRVISSASGILANTIRTWETRYQIFNPIRGINGERLYSEEDLYKAKAISKLLDDGHTISSLANLSLKKLESLLAITEDVSDQKSKSAYTEDSTELVLKVLFQAVGKFDIEKIAFEMKRLRVALGAKDFIFKVVLPLMQKIGNLVAKEKYSITQEHIVSTIIRDQLGQMDLSLASDKECKIALATPDGNLHELAILIANILCRVNQVGTSYLGASHPAFCLAEALNALKSEVLVLGVLSSDHWNYQENMIPFLKSLDSQLIKPITVYLGGAKKLPFPKFNKIKELVLVDSFEEFDNLLHNHQL